jgi:hypothetical protein
VLENGPAQLGKEIKSSHVFFASLDGAHFYRKAKPGEKLVFEQKLTKLRDPLAIFEGTVASNGERVAKVERLVLAFGEQLTPGSATPAIVSELETPAALAVSIPSNGSENGRS